MPTMRASMSKSMTKSKTGSPSHLRQAGWTVLRIWEHDLAAKPGRAWPAGSRGRWRRSAGSRSRGSDCRRFFEFAFEHCVKRADDGFLLPGHRLRGVDAPLEYSGGEWVGDAEDAVAAGELEQFDAEWLGCVHAKSNAVRKASTDCGVAIPKRCSASRASRSKSASQKSATAAGGEVKATVRPSSISW